METLKTGKIEDLLGAEADALLNHTCKTIDKGSLNLPGPDFVDRSFAASNRSPQVMRSLQQQSALSDRFIAHLLVRNIRIGNYVQLAPKVAITGGDHLIDQVGVPIIHTGLDGHRQVQTKQLGVVIEDDAWIGFAAIILDGVTIGEGSVVGAGSVVTRDIPPYSIYAGCPARKLRDRFENEAQRIEHSRKIGGRWHQQSAEQTQVVKVS